MYEFTGKNALLPLTTSPLAARRQLRREEGMAASFKGPVQEHIEAALAEHFTPTHVVVTNESCVLMPPFPGCWLLA